MATNRRHAGRAALANEHRFDTFGPAGGRAAFHVSMFTLVTGSVTSPDYIAFSQTQEGSIVTMTCSVVFARP
jgi:hypothetical protein